MDSNTVTPMQHYGKKPSRDVKHTVKSLSKNGRKKPKFKSNDILLMSLVSKEPSLYNTAHGDYRNQHIKQKKWQQISKEVNVWSVDECKLKWKALRDQYCRELKRFKKLPDGPDKNKWKYFEYMEFLRPFALLRYYRPRNTKSISKVKCAQPLQRLKQSSTQLPPAGPAPPSLLLTSDDDYGVDDVDTKSALNTIVTGTNQKLIDNLKTPFELNANVYDQFMDLVRTNSGLSKDEKQQGKDTLNVLANHELFFEMELISQIKSEPVFYNPRNSNYRNVKVKDLIWQRIAKTLNQSETKCRLKWKALRDQFIREHKRLESVSDIMGEPKWKHYEQMDFLLAYIKMRGSKHSAYTESKDCQLDDQKEMSNDYSIATMNSNTLLQSFAITKKAVKISIPERQSPQQSQHTPTAVSSGTSCQSDSRDPSRPRTAISTTATEGLLQQQQQQKAQQPNMAKDQQQMQPLTNTQSVLQPHSTAHGKPQSHMVLASKPCVTIIATTASSLTTMSFTTSTTTMGKPTNGGGCVSTTSTNTVATPITAPITTPIITPITTTNILNTITPESILLLDSMIIGDCMDDDVVGGDNGHDENANDMLTSVNEEHEQVEQQLQDSMQILMDGDTKDPNNDNKTNNKNSTNDYVVDVNANDIMETVDGEFVVDETTVNSLIEEVSDELMNDADSYNDVILDDTGTNDRVVDNALNGQPQYTIYMGNATSERLSADTGAVIRYPDNELQFEYAEPTQQLTANALEQSLLQQYDAYGNTQQQQKNTTAASSILNGVPFIVNSGGTNDTVSGHDIDTQYSGYTSRFDGQINNPNSVTPAASMAAPQIHEQQLAEPCNISSIMSSNAPPSAEMVSVPVQHTKSPSSTSSLSSSTSSSSSMNVGDDEYDIFFRGLAMKTRKSKITSDEFTDLQIALLQVVKNKLS